MLTNFTKLPNEVILDESLSIYEKMVYIVLASYADSTTRSCYPSYGTIAKKVGCSSRKAIEVVKRLVELGHITKIQKTPDGKNAHACNLYIVNLPEQKDDCKCSTETPTNVSSLPDIKHAFPNEYDSLPNASNSPPAASVSSPYDHPAHDQDPWIKIQSNQNRSISHECDRLTEKLDEHFEHEYFQSQPELYGAYRAMISYMTEMLTMDQTKVGSVFMSREVLEQIIFKATSSDLVSFIVHIQKNSPYLRIVNHKAYFKTAWVEWIRANDMLYPPITSTK